MRLDDRRTSAHGGSATADELRFLLIQLYHLGDVLLCSPAIRQLRRTYPDATIDFLTGNVGAQALDGNPHLDSIIRWRRGGRAFLTLAPRLRRARYDAAVDFLSKPSTAWLVAATGAPVRAGVRGHGPRNAVYTHLSPREHGPLYMPLQKLRLLRALQVEPDPRDARLEVFPSDSARADAARLLEELLPGDGFVAVSPVARHAFKRWAPSRWATVIDSLVEAGRSVLLTGGPGEDGQLEEVVRELRHDAPPRYVATDVAHLAAIYERCAAWVGNDGGAKHIAAAAGAPTVTVARWTIGPVWNDLRAGSDQIALEAPPPQGCDLVCKRCPHLACLGEVGAEAVVDAVLQAPWRERPEVGSPSP